MKNKFANILGAFTVIILLNFLASKFYNRFDLTEDKRYTLSEATENIIENIEDIVTIKVYLEGDFPAEFKRLQTETKLHLEELSAINKNIHFRFINPEDEIEQLINQGLQPSRLQVQENNKLSELVIFPWAVVKAKNKSENIDLLKDIVNNSQDEQLESSIQNLEYAFANAIHKVTTKKSKTIAILKGNGELEDIYIADFLKKLSEYYLLAPFTLDSVAKSPEETLKHLKTFDLAIVAKPTKKFSEEEKLVLDQFTMNGGKSIWLIDNVQAELDSLMQTGEALTYARDLGLTDFFFNYGARINQDLITDLNSSQITLATGNIGNQTQFNQFQWEYFPLLNSKNNHSINKNIEMVNTKFTNSIDTLKNNIKKTVLLQSSIFSKTVGTPKIVSLTSISKEKDKEDYSNGNKLVAVLLEGEFKSAFNGRVKPFLTSNLLESGKDSKIILISDGDVIANSLSKGNPLQLGVDKWTGQHYGNKEFLLNCVNYLLDDSGLIHVRSKTVKIDFLNKQLAFEESKKWQFINLLFPIILLAIFGIVFNFFRRKKYQ